MSLLSLLVKSLNMLKKSFNGGKLKWERVQNFSENNNPYRTLNIMLLSLKVASTLEIAVHSIHVQEYETVSLATVSTWRAVRQSSGLCTHKPYISFVQSRAGVQCTYQCFGNFMQHVYYSISLLCINIPIWRTSKGYKHWFEKLESSRNQG